MMLFLNICDIDIIKCPVARGCSFISIYSVKAWLLHKKVAKNSYENQRDQVG